jgi:formate dehydrogenase subunit gamma
MTMRILRFAAMALLLTGLLAGPLAAQPRPAAPVSGFNPTAAAVQEGQLLRELDRVTGRVSIPDARAGTLIQPAGQQWRNYQKGIFPWIAAVCVLGMLAVLAAFYAVRGRVRIHGGPSGRTIRRFTGFERFIHWLAACSWCVLALSGLNLAFGRELLMPLIGADNFSDLTEAGKYAHNFVAFPFTLGIALMLLRWVRHNIPGRIDLEWLRAGGGIVGDKDPPSGKFNGGQKAIFWLVVLGGGAVAASGFLLIFPFTLTDIAGQQTAHMVHGGLAMLMVAAMLGHIYIGTLGMEGAFSAMGNGQVDLNWARTHHNLWVAEQEHGGRDATPAE